MRAMSYLVVPTFYGDHKVRDEDAWVCDVLCRAIVLHIGGDQTAVSASFVSDPFVDSFVDAFSTTAAL